MERLELDTTMVVKRDQTIENFSRSKMAKSIRKAALKESEPLPREMDVFIDRVARTLASDREGPTVRSHEIGRIILDQMRDGTPRTDVTCIRYSIVFHGSKARLHAFEGVGDFLTWLRNAFAPAEVIQVVQAHPVEVLNRSGAREAFEYKKLERSIGLAAKGRGSETDVARMASQLAQKALHRLGGQSLVASMQIAQEVMSLLLATDGIAYLRYASAVKRYASAEDFLREALWVLEHQGLPQEP